MYTCVKVIYRILLTLFLARFPDMLAELDTSRLSGDYLGYKAVIFVAISVSRSSSVNVFSEVCFWGEVDSSSRNHVISGHRSESGGDSEIAIYGAQLEFFVRHVRPTAETACRLTSAVDANWLKADREHYIVVMRALTHRRKLMIYTAVSTW